MLGSAIKVDGEPYTVVGDGTQRRDFVYVTDVARAYLLAFRKGCKGITIFRYGGRRGTLVKFSDVD